MAAAEDTIQALIDHLVGPLLPLRATSHDPPPLSKQEAVANQMHAVVLLYNYYHRKRFPHLEFLDFEAFCKAASIAKLSLLAYMKYMNRCEEAVVNLDKQLSITEKKIMDACNICSALDASKDAPIIEGWPVSKVAVFLSDPTKKKCFLQFSSITQGVWSLVERDLDEPLDDLNGGPQAKMPALKKKKSANVPLANGSFVREDVLQQLALSIVERKTGIDQANLSIVECHLTYSLSKEKTTTCLFIMSYTKVGSNKELEVSIKEMMSSLGGPIVNTGLTPEVTSVVEYFNLLPYVDILSNWLSRETPQDGPFQLLRQEINLEGGCSNPNRKCTMADYESKNKYCDSKKNLDISSPKLSKPANEIVNKNRDETCFNRLSGTRYKSQNNVAASHMDQKINAKFVMGNKINEGSDENGSYETVSRPQNKTGSSLLQNPRQSLHDEDATSKVNISSDAHLEKREKEFLQVSIDAAVNCSKEKADVGDPVKRQCVTKLFTGKPLSGADAREADIRFQDGTFSSDLPIVPKQHSPEDSDMHQLLLTSRKNDLLLTSLQILQKKRDELSKQHRQLEDEIAQCEMNIYTILSGQDDVMFRFDSIIESCNTLNSSQMQTGASLVSEQCPTQPIKRKRLSEAILTLRSPCEELDEICHRNSWILPRYTVFPSNNVDGKFQAYVMVQGVDFEHTDGGELKASPREARDSAAIHMLSTLRSKADQAQ